MCLFFFLEVSIFLAITGGEKVNSERINEKPTIYFLNKIPQKLSLSISAFTVYIYIS